MVVLNRIYTRTGDDGTTALGSGARRKKYDLRVSAYGTLDEVNAVIGIARLHAGGDRALDAMLAHIQNDLFDVEADLCLSEKGPGGARMTVTDAQVEWLEQRIDELNASLQRERVEFAVAQGALETTRRDYARLQRDISAGRGAPQRGATLEEVSDNAKEPSKSRNGRGGGRGPKVVEAEPEGGAAEPPSTR